MSLNESETGSFVIPADEWEGFHRALVSAAQQLRTRLLSEEKTMRSLLEPAFLAAGVNGMNYGDLCRLWRQAIRTIPAYPERDDLWHRIISDRHDAPLGMKPFVEPAAIADDASTLEFGEFGSCSLEFNAPARTVRWEVYENNRACEKAHGMTVPSLFLDLIGKMPWAPDTGGSIEREDEYSNGISRCVLDARPSGPSPRR